MPINWQAVEAVGVWVASISAAVNILFFLHYLGIMRDQAEGLSRPVIVVVSSRTLPNDTALWLEDVIPTELAEGGPRLKNVGNGPALHLRWSYERHNATFRGECDYLGPGEEFIFPFPAELGLGEKKIQCVYESVGRVRYNSTTTLRDRVVATSLIERR